MKKNTSTITQRLIELRKEHGLKQLEVAKIAEVSIQAMSKYENGDIAISMDKIQILADYYNVDPAYIAGWTNERKKKDLGRLTELFVINEDSSSVGQSFNEKTEGKRIFIPSGILTNQKEYVGFVIRETDYNDVLKGLLPGNIAIFEKGVIVDDHEIGCFALNENAICVAQKIDLPEQTLLYKKTSTLIDKKEEHCLGKLVMVIQKCK